MSFTGNSALSGFAEGFANVFGEQQAEKRRMEHAFSTEMFKTMLDHPEYANTDAGKRVLKGFGPQGAEFASMLVDATHQARNSPIVGAILGGGMPGADAGGSAAPTGDPSAGGDSSAPQGYQPTPGVPTTGKMDVNVPGVGLVKDVDFAQLDDRKKMIGALQIAHAWYTHNEKAYPDPAMREAASMHAAYHQLMAQPGGAANVPQALLKYLQNVDVASTKAQTAAGFVGPRAIAEAQGRTSVEQPIKDAEQEKKDRNAFKSYEWGLVENGVVNKDKHPAEHSTPAEATSLGYVRLSPAEQKPESFLTRATKHLPGMGTKPRKVTATPPQGTSQPSSTQQSTSTSGPSPTTTIDLGGGFQLRPHAEP